MTRASVKARLKEAMYEVGAAEEQRGLEEYLALIDQEAAASKAHKDAERTLQKRVQAKYAHLSEDEIKVLVVDDKWLTALAAAVHGELDCVSQALTGRVQQLAERYATLLPKLMEEINVLTTRVDQHLRKMGYSWI